MISYLKGAIHSVNKESVTIIINGALGFSVFMHERDLKALIAGQEAELLCYHHITDRSQELYGFLTAETKAIFVLLIDNIAGIGPKSALKLIAKIDAATLQHALVAGDASALETLGVGRKTAEKIIAGLKGKVATGPPSAPHPREPRQSEVIDALVSLGYSKNEAEAALNKLHTEEKTSEEIIKDALKTL